MKCTIQENRMGHLHIWKGWNRKLKQIAKYNYIAVRPRNDEMENGESPVYLQMDTDVEVCKESLTIDQKENLSQGYQVNARIDELYWSED